jgi:hypothetical protein
MTRIISLLRDILGEALIGLAPGTPLARERRIAHLSQNKRLSRDQAAAVVYTRDVLFMNRKLSKQEYADYQRIGDLVKRGEIIMPADSPR